MLFWQSHTPSVICLEARSNFRFRWWQIVDLNLELVRRLSRIIEAPCCVLLIFIPHLSHAFSLGLFLSETQLIGYQTLIACLYLIAARLLFVCRRTFYQICGECTAHFRIFRKKKIPQSIKWYQIFSWIKLFLAHPQSIFLISSILLPFWS